jgi:hypothetical protein
VASVELTRLANEAQEKDVWTWRCAWARSRPANMACPVYGS